MHLPHKTDQQEKKQIEIKAKNKVLKVANKMMLKERSVAVSLLHSMVPIKIANDISNGNEVMPQVSFFSPSSLFLAPRLLNISVCFACLFMPTRF